MTKQNALGPRLFTLAEAEAQLPYVQERLARFQDFYAQYQDIQRHLSVLRLVSCSGGDEKNPDSNTLGTKEREQAGIMTQLQAIQEELIEAGCVPKSIQDGLVDFFALKEGRLVFLCWKQGESRIRAWHTLEGGYAARMPIESFVDEPATDEVEES